MKNGALTKLRAFMDSRIENCSVEDLGPTDIIDHIIARVKMLETELTNARIGRGNADRDRTALLRAVRDWYDVPEYVVDHEGRQRRVTVGETLQRALDRKTEKTDALIRLTNMCEAAHDLALIGCADMKKPDGSRLPNRDEPRLLRRLFRLIAEATAGSGAAFYEALSGASSDDD